MKIEIDNDYIEWIKETNPELFASINKKPINNQKEILTDYINRVLWEHKKSW